MAGRLIKIPDLNKMSPDDIETFLDEIFINASEAPDLKTAISSDPTAAPIKGDPELDNIALRDLLDIKQRRIQELKTQLEEANRQLKECRAELLAATHHIEFLNSELEVFRDQNCRPSYGRIFEDFNNAFTDYREYNTILSKQNDKLLDHIGRLQEMLLERTRQLSEILSSRPPV